MPGSRLAGSRSACTRTRLSLVAIDLGRDGSAFAEFETEPAGARHRDIQRQLREYFEGKRRVFSLDLALEGSDFQKGVWEAVARIPYGRTASYGEIAHLIGRPKASRAVGAANGANPIPIVIPCHRVIGSNGSLTGYGGGLPLKRRLLALEGVLPSPAVQIRLF
ncbi:MAG: methylated-DNA--[protein]-cysteine S-methyltransferase [Vicinamibacteria bacterium]